MSSTVTSASPAFRVRDPAPLLAPFVQSFWMHTSYVQSHAEEIVLPNGAGTLIFSIDEAGRAESLIAGPRSESSRLNTSRPFTAIGVAFRPGGMFPFFRIASSELHNTQAPLEDLWPGAAVLLLRDALCDTTRAEDPLRLLENALAARLADGRALHYGVAYALDAIDRANGDLRVREMAARVGISERRFVRLFQEQVGVPPKLLCRLRRFQQALRVVRASADVDWTDIGLTCGYYDQPHFNHDFREFAGVSPSTYLRRRTSPSHIAVPAG